MVPLFISNVTVRLCRCDTAITSPAFKMRIACSQETVSGVELALDWISFLHPNRRTLIPAKEEIRRFILKTRCIGIWGEIMVNREAIDFSVRLTRIFRIVPNPGMGE